MARVKGALNTRKRHKKILKLAKGFRGAESKQFRIANQAVMRSMQNAYVGRGLCLHSPLKTWQQKEDDPVSADLRCFHL